MTNPTLGMAGTIPLDLDLDRLVGAHLGVVANAGGGKSGLIRRLLEQTHGRIQHIVLDIEDEFYTLRESLDYVIAGGDGGDIPATVANAAGLATAALTHGFSLIVQLNDLGHDGARAFVDTFLAAMIAAPRELWHPVLVVIDETQRFDPASIRMLTERGRKRGFTAVLASQRLPKIDPNIRGDVNNWIMGRVGQTLDRGIMADQLGFTKAEATANLRQIDVRHFWAMGPALSREPVLFRVGDVETTMVRPGQGKVSTPPAPEALREILSGLAVTSRSEPNADVPDNSEDAYSAGREAGAAIRQRDARIADLETERDALGEICERKNRRIADVERDLDFWRTRAEARGLLLQRAREALVENAEVLEQAEQMAAAIWKSDTPAAPPVTPANPGGSHVDLSAERANLSRNDKRGGSTATGPSRASDQVPAVGKMVDALARHYPRRLPLAHVAKIAGVSVKSSQWTKNRAAFDASDEVQAGAGGYTLTDAAAAARGLGQRTNDPAELLRFWTSAFPPATASMLRVIVGEGGMWRDRDWIADQAGVSRTSSGLGGGLRELLDHGLIERGSDGYRAAEVWTA